VSDVFGVWTATAFLWLAVWGMSGSLRVSAAVAGLVGCLVAAATLIDVGDDL
jgi:uncharacterized membrane protein (GlpM family)